MKSLFNCIIVAALCFVPASAHAVDGFASFGAYADQENVYSRPDGGQATYKSEVEVGHRVDFLTGQLRPWVNLITLMDQYNGDGSFHPASIRYTVGIGWEKPLTGRLSFFTSVRHFCWHPIDADGAVAQANYFEVGFRF